MRSRDLSPLRRGTRRDRADLADVPIPAAGSRRRELGDRYPDPGSRFLASEDGYALLHFEAGGNSMIVELKALDGRVLDRSEHRGSRRWRQIAPYVSPPASVDFSGGEYRSPLIFDDGRQVGSREDWRRRREEILEHWNSLLGRWPLLLERPSIEKLSEERRDGLVQRRARVEAAEDLQVDGYLLLPDGAGPFPGVLVVYYEPETGAGLRPADTVRDFGYQLALRGFATLSIGWPREYTDAKSSTLQPLSCLAYLAANCGRALAALPEVDRERIGICGHSFGGKWALFAMALCDEFACGAWSDPGIVFDESRPNVNYWEPWYIGWEAGRKRKPGIPSPENPRTGPYARLVEEGRDLHELLALMAPRPFLVSGGSEDPPERWRALRHVVDVNRLLGFEGRVAMTNRPGHSPTPESNEILVAFFEYFLSGPYLR